MIASVISRIGEVFDVELWAQWLAELDRTFVFLLLLPFVVAVVGLWAAYRDGDLARADESQGEASRLLQEREEQAGGKRRAWRGPALRE